MTTVHPLDDTDPAVLAARVLDEEARRQDEQRAKAAQQLVIADDLLPGVGDDELSFREVLQAGGRRTVVVLTALALVDELDRAAFAVLSPDIQKDLGLSDVAPTARGRDCPRHPVRPLPGRLLGLLRPTGTCQPLRGS